MLSESFTRLLTPGKIVRHVSDISVEWLKSNGVRAVVTDLDNTLVAYRAESVEDEISLWLSTLLKADMGVCVASNTRRLSRLRHISDKLGVLHVPANCGKPGTRGIRHALKLLDASPTEAAMVGDQLFTDMVAGNRLGMTTILVNPLSHHEFIGTRLISRRLERLVLRGSRSRVR